MSIQQLGYEFDAYSNLLFVPVGRRYSSIRSIGHKEERAVLSRIQQSVTEELKMCLYSCIFFWLLPGAVSIIKLIRYSYKRIKKSLFIEGKT